MEEGRTALREERGRTGERGARRGAIGRGTCRVERGFPQPLATTSPSSRGFRAPNKGGSGGRALLPGPPSAPGRGRTKARGPPPGPRRRILPDVPLPTFAPAPRGPQTLCTPTPSAPHTHRMEVCSATAGTASSSRCMQRTVLRKHRQRLGHPAPGFWATAVSTPQPQHSTSASRQGRAERTAMTTARTDAGRTHRSRRARRVLHQLRTAPARPPGRGPRPSCAGGGGPPAVHMRAASPFPPPPPQGRGGARTSGCASGRRTPLPTAGLLRVRRRRWRPGF